MTDYDIASDAQETAWAASCGFDSASEYHANYTEQFMERWMYDADWFQGDPE